MVTLKTTIDGILANFVYNGNLIGLPTSPTMCLHQQRAFGLKSTLTGFLAYVPKMVQTIKQILKRQCHVNYLK